MILTPEERFAVVVALVDTARHQRLTHGGNLIEKLPGKPFMLTPAQLETLARRIEQEGEPNGDLVS